jgi:ABC-type uncharacterized transport system substrate-binding protein
MYRILAIAICSISVIFAGQASAAKKVLIINSYHAGYKWCDDIVSGAEKTLKAAGIEYKTIHMDTKRNPSEEFKKNAAAKVKSEADAYAPDAIIAADDNASKYVIVPFYKDSKIPVAFCGINWDASIYGFPCSNVTGMLEVACYSVIDDNMKKFAKGTRVGYLGVDNETSRKDALGTEQANGVKFVKNFAKTFEDWKSAFIEMQSTTDWMIVETSAGITGFDTTAAKEFVLANTKVPTATLYDDMLSYATIAIVKSGSEQGEYAANAVIKMLSGTPASAIAVGKNKKADLGLNMKIANKLGITFDMAYLKQAKFIQK